MPIERIREQFKDGAQMFFALGRNQQQQTRQKNELRPEAISVGSTASTVSTATSASSGASSAAPPARRAQPIVLSSDEEGSESEEDASDEDQKGNTNEAYDSEIEILSEPPQSKAQSTQSNITKSTTQLPNPNIPVRPLQPYNGVNTARPARVDGQATYKPHSVLQNPLPTPIHIPSNKDLPKSGVPMKPQTLQSQPQQIRVVSNPQVHIPIAESSPVVENMTAAETEQALKELMSGNIIDDEEVEIGPEDKIVEGFKSGIELLDHQVLGRNWMAGRENRDEKRYGGILADDMGLGKTIQTLTRMVDNPATREDRDDGFSASTLVICPLALVGQWADEIKKMTKLSVLKHQGTSRTTDPYILQKHNVVVTTYDTVKSEYAAFAPEAKDESKGGKSKSKESQGQGDSDSDSEAEDFGRNVKKRTTSNRKVKNALFQVQWFRVVLDEAHNIKNHNTKGAIACCELKGRFRWCLTGTPLQNNIIELYSLLKFLNIRPWNQYDKFNRELAQPIKNGRGAGTAMKKLQIILKQVMLRRRKDDIINGKKLIELPQRTVEVISCPFDAAERTFYEALENKMDEVLEKLLNQDKGSKYISVLLLLLRLRQACNHPLLVSKDYKKDLEAVESQASKKDSEADADDLVAAFGQMGVAAPKCQMCTMDLTPKNSAEGKWRGYCVTCVPLAEKAALAERERPSSAKIRMILKLLQDIEERSDCTEKTIIFSQFTSMLDLIMPFLKEKGIRFVRYDGSMTPVDREAALAKIRNSDDVKVILISFKAGSTGLNLTACNNVILVDLWWNPALEDQAFDRAHRYGQTRDVNIFKLKIDNTVEERILLLQEKKRALAQAALGGDKLKNMKLGMDDLLALFRPNARDDSDDEGPW